MPSTRTLAPPKAREVTPTSRHIAANQEAVEKVFAKFQHAQESLAGTFNEQIRERRTSPYLGETVLYRMLDGPGQGEQRPAFIVLIHEGEGDSTRCALKVLCSPDHDGTGVLDEPNVRRGTGLGEWLPSDERVPATEPKLEERVAVGEAAV